MPIATPSSARARSRNATEALSRTPTDRRLDVLYLSASGQLGGAERVLLDLIGALRRDHPRLRMAALLGAQGPLEGELMALGVEVLSLPFPAAFARLGDFSLGAGARGGAIGFALRALRAAPTFASYAMRAAMVIRRRAPLIVHSNGFKMHALAALTRGRGTAVVWHLHDFLAGRRVMARLSRVLAPRVDAAIANSRAVALEWCEATGRPATVALNAVDLERFHPRGTIADLDGLAGLPAAPAGTVRLGLVATLAAWKGHDVFLRALARLPRDRAWRGYVVGGSVYQTLGSEVSLDALRALADSLGIADRVGFTGFTRETADAMRALDVVVHASVRPEPFGLVIAEAMASARASVVSAAGGAVELIEDGADALAFPPGDVDALAACLTRLVAEPALRQRLATRARRSAEARFAPARLARQVAAVYAAHGVQVGA